ncbi:MAG TPA: alpha/beta hydrolase [Xanthobacteraceae bacterium]|nr:alpha/beta hydrolase [Xanthobacteraceae bacterium]
MHARTWLGLAFAAMVLPLGAHADQAVKIGDAYALLNKPASARAGLILIPGGNGVMNVRPDGTFGSLGGNQLVRTRKDYLSYGLATLTIDVGVDVAAAVRYMRSVTPVVVVVGTSRGTLRAPKSLPAHPNGLVLTSGFWGNMPSLLGSPAALPPTLVIEHRHDGCRPTSPAGVPGFQAWAGSKVKVVWLDGGIDKGDPCEARAYHGFNGIDGQVVSAVAQFAKSVH